MLRGAIRGGGGCIYFLIPQTEVGGGEERKERGEVLKKEAKILEGEVPSFSCREGGGGREGGGKKKKEKGLPKRSFLLKWKGEEERRGKLVCLKKRTEKRHFILGILVLGRGAKKEKKKDKPGRWEKLVPTSYLRYQKGEGGRKKKGRGGWFI